ncbi:MAG: hypothetical protein FWC25_00360, partial [Dehalococcoidia bacterium]|nr:hypothetical protein [Dehalococcoidia bacterium]
KAGEKRAIDFFQSREDIQRDALKHAIEVFDEYNIEAQNLLVAYIDIPKDLLDTQTKKEIAIQQKEQFDQEAEAQERLIAVREKSARAEMQKNVIDAKLSIDINRDTARAIAEKAKGEQEAIQLIADANAYKSRVEGKGIADAYSYQRESIGQDNVFMIRFMEEVAKGKTQIVPQIMVSGDGKSGGILDAALAQWLKRQQNIE